MDDFDQRPDEPIADPLGDTAYPGGSGLLPPTADMTDPIPETGMPAEPEADDEPGDLGEPGTPTGEGR